MTVTANIHNATRMDPSQSDGTAWLNISTKDVPYSAAIFMPYAQAVAVAAAFNSYNDAKVQEAAE